MVIRDLRDYIEKCEAMGTLKRINGADWNLEIGALSDLYRQRKSVLFDDINGYPKGYRVITNVITSESQLKLVMGVPAELSTMEMVKYLKDKLTHIKPIPPLVVKTGPILENVLTGDSVDLSRFPAPRWHELDGGRYIGTGDMIITRDPDEGWVNFGTYRVMVHDKTTGGSYIDPGRHGRIMREKYWSKGQSCPVAIVCGQDPTLLFASATSVPWGTSEYDYAGGLKGEPIEIIEAPVTGLPVPAAAEIVLEGEIPPPEVETRVEGPFAEWTGYYASGARPEPVVKVKSILFRNNPILGGQSAGNVPSNIRTRPCKSATLWEELEKAGVPDVRGVWFMETGGSFLMIAVSIKQRYSGHARHTGLAAAGCRQGALGNRFVIVVDDDIDPSNEDDVWWAVATRCDPINDIEIIKEGTSSRIDPRLEPDKIKKMDFTTSRAIIIACKPFHWIKDFPPVVRQKPEYLESLIKKFESETSDISKDDMRRLVHGVIFR